MLNAEQARKKMEDARERQKNTSIYTYIDNGIAKCASVGRNSYTQYDIDVYDNDHLQHEIKKRYKSLGYKVSVQEYGSYGCIDTVDMTFSW